MNDKIEFITQVFSKISGIRAKKLRTGSLRRHAIGVKLRNGEVVDNYRTQWLQACTQEVLELLRKQARDFNSTHDDERASKADLLDIVNMTMSVLSKK